MNATRESLRIGSVSKRTGLSIDAIRFYERRHLLKSPGRTVGGYRIFREQDVDTLCFIERAQQMGFSLDEIGELLSLRSRGKACLKVQRLLESKLAVVCRKIEELQGLKRELESSLDECNATLERRAADPTCPVLAGIASPKRTARR